MIDGVELEGLEHQSSHSLNPTAGLKNIAYTFADFFGDLFTSIDNTLGGTSKVSFSEVKGDKVTTKAANFSISMDTKTSTKTTVNLAEYFSTNGVFGVVDNTSTSTSTNYSASGKISQIPVAANVSIDEEGNAKISTKISTAGVGLGPFLDTEGQLGVDGALVVPISSNTQENENGSETTVKSYSGFIISFFVDWSKEEESTQESQN